MNTHSAPKASLADVKQLTYFRVYKTHPSEQHGTIKLFSNGNQQCPIKIGLVAADVAGNPIDLTEAEVKSALTLIHYDDGTALGGGDGYTPSFDKNGFTWTEDAISHKNETTRDGKTEAGRPLHDLTATRIQTYTLYVSASPGSSGLVVAACFQASNTFFTTNSSVEDSDGQGQDGQFNSSVEVLLAEPPYLSASDFGASSEGIVSGKKVGSSALFYWATEYYLNPKLNGRALPLLAVGANASAEGASPKGAFGFHTYGSALKPVKWGISYYSQPGSTEAQEGSLPVAPLNYIEVDSKEDASPKTPYVPSSMYEKCVGSIQGPSPNRVVIGILKGNLDGQFKDSAGAAVSDVSSTTMHILDAYGNDHAVFLSYDASKDVLTIA